jgi:homeobox protein cut-like
MEDVTNFTLGDASVVLEFWKEFDLDTRRLTLDQNCVDMREMKTSSINGRKRLNDATKVFRGKTRDEQAGGITELLKLYQEEIDQLSRRSKFSESAFYSLYKSIYDAPNPSISIEGLINMVAATSTNQLEIERLRGELAQYDEEFQLLKNQDITIRRLEDQLEEYRGQIEDKVMEEVFKRTKEVEGQAELRISEVREVQRTSERRLAAVVETMKQAQSSTDRAQTQMFEISSQAEERVGALSSENAILAEGMERALGRVSELEGEISALRSSLSLAGVSSCGAPQRLGVSGGSKGTNGKGEEDYETLQLVISELRHEIRSKEDTLRAEKQRIEGKHREALQLLSREREALGKVKLELAERPTKEDLFSLRRQVKILQKVAFNAQEEDDTDVSTTSLLLHRRGDPYCCLGASQMSVCTSNEHDILLMTSS